MVEPMREFGYLPKGIMDPHDLPKGAQRAGRLPQDILTELEAAKAKEEAAKPATAASEADSYTRPATSPCATQPVSPKR